MKFLAEKSNDLNNVSYINNLFLLVAGFIPSLILKLILQGDTIPNWSKWIFCIVLYYTVLQFFLCPLFWIIIAVIFFFLLARKIIDYFKRKDEPKQ